MLENNHTIPLTLNGESRAFTVEPQEALLDGRLRAHAIARLLHGFFQPLSPHFELESKIRLMHRQGYIGRNPASGDWYAHPQKGFRSI